MCVLDASKGRAIFNNSEFGTRKDLFKEKVQLKKRKELILRSILRELKFGNLDGQRKGGWVRQEVGTVNSLPQKGAKEKLRIPKPPCFWPTSGPPHLSQFWKLL